MTLFCIKCGRPETDHIVLDHEYYYIADSCEICLGTKGGMRGNENIVDGFIMCDYCHASWKDKGKEN